MNTEERTNTQAPAYSEFFLYKYMCVRSLNDEYMYYNIHA